MNGAGSVGRQEGNHVRQRLRGYPARYISVGHGGAIIGRIDDRGKHAIDVDALVTQFGRHRLGETDQRGLGGSVGPHVCSALERGRRADSHHLAPALPDQVRHHGGGNVQQAARVQTQQKVPGSGRSLVHLLAHAKASCHMAQGVDASDARHCVGHTGSHLVTVQQVDVDQNRVGQGAKTATQRVGVAIQQHQACATLVEGGRHGRAQLAGSPGDQNCFSLHAHARTPSRFCVW